jgi:outer membrane protein OmpA-like peptidoglycan-associated protein
MRVTVRPGLVSGIALALALTLNGCGSDDSTDTARIASAALDCAAAPDIKADTPTIAILGGVGPKLADYDQDIETVVRVSKDIEARVIVNGVSGASTAPNLLSNVVMVGEGDNPLFRSRDLECKEATIDDSFLTLRDGKTPRTFNVFAALDALAGNLENNPSKAPVDVVLLTPLASVGGDVDLTDPKTLAKPAEAISTLAGQSLIPSCKNWRIHAVAPDTGLDDARAAQLKEFWRLYAQKCSGLLVAWTDHLATFPATRAIQAADTSQIEVQRTTKEVTATLGSDVLFGADSAELEPSADAALNQLLGLAREHGGRIEITGHINPVGAATEEGDALSLQRADAVKTWLVAHQIDPQRIKALGKGATKPVNPHPSTEEEKSANRRVVAVIHTMGE